MVAVIHWWLGWPRLWQAWQTLSLFEVVLVLVMLLLSYHFRALRIYYYFRHQGPLTRLGCDKLVLNHTAWNNFLPMRSGELSYPLLVKRYFGIGYSRSLASLLWLRLMDLHTLVMLGLGLVWALWPHWALVPLALLTLSLPLLTFALKRRLQRWNRQRSARLDQALAGLPHRLGLLIQLWGLTWLNWGVKLVLFILVIQAMSDVPATIALAAAIGGELSSVLPIHGIAGFGTYEAGMMLPLIWAEMDAKDLLAAAVNVHLLILGASVLGLMLAQWLPVPNSTTEKRHTL
ncbi:MAG: lysylphosphatidylglycerol synthase transmembrane domain-containing protein [Hydrogenovibrio sp.]|uniref:lysylphosphatidylglycerol synthase transmembrane domain-containing protein n=1 Tax=Hydrogenovibrio TaxID=28884 RepID=UPI00036DA16C|nr:MULTISPECIES: lysylphosphatidylglycerol synthase transmembrane domain-containing protein [Hydrogenovibrio]MDR9498477.1 lysylphosphatidylglycerol synthase transmembrane domain-containing protein [Hydrogenovibrio sp.]